MTTKPRYYITTAISYPNGSPHIGHAYELIATDAMARFQRCDGKDVYFLTGTDEHGQKMLQTARKEGLTAQALADRNSAEFKKMAAMLNASNDDFIRTSEARHHRSVQEVWRRMEAAGDLYKDTYAGWYSVRDEAYYQESETEVREDGVRCGPQGTPVEWVEEESYFFRLSAFQERLLRHYEDNPDFIGPAERRNEVVSFVKSGLKDLSMSRTTFDWGVKVPGDDRHVMYVWVDALTNYITGVGFPDEDDPLWKYWPADVHIIGKDIIRFHSVYWPAFLMSAGLALPKRVFAHGFVFNRGEKMSKSVGNVIDPGALIDAYGLDQVRYFFLREVPFGQDGNYSHDAIVGRINSDLANDLGNLAQRSLSMIAKNCEGRVPEAGAILGSRRGDARPGRRAAADRARSDGEAGDTRCSGRHFRCRRRGKPLFCRTGAMGTQENGSWTDGDGALRHRRGGPTDRDPLPALHAGFGGKAPGHPRGGRGRRAASKGSARSGRLEGGTPLPKPVPVFPRYVEPEALKEG